jgi:hypothetical protein
MISLDEQVVEMRYLTLIIDPDYEFLMALESIRTNRSGDFGLNQFRAPIEL